MEWPRPRDGRLPIFVSFLILQSFCFFCVHAFAAPTPFVQVLVERNKSEVAVRGFDLVLWDQIKNKKLAHATDNSGLKFRCQLGGKLTAYLSKNRYFKMSGPVRVASLGGFIRVKDRQYRNELFVHSFNGDCVVVNGVDLEKYVAGVLNSEMSASWNLNTLKAQAIAARTYAVYQMKQRKNGRLKAFSKPFDLSGTVKDQVYEGAHQERYKTILAVRQTRGMILSYDGDPIKAFYHSTCGGRTETAGKVWGKDFPYIRSVKCYYCQTSPRYNWIHDVSKEKLEKMLQKQQLVKGHLTGVEVVRRNQLGRADKIKIIGTAGVTFTKATRLRDMIGTTQVMSTDFILIKNPKKFVFVGHGSGHGVGMCQYGARTMGRRGFTYAKILKKYYPTANLSKIY